MAFAIGGCLGADFGAVSTDPDFALMTTAEGSDGYAYVYVQANGAIAASQTDISVTTAGQASDGSGTYVGPAVAFADNQYGWVRSATLIAA